MNESKQRRLKDIKELLEKDLSLLKNLEESRRVESNARTIEGLDNEIKRTRIDIEKHEEERKQLEKAGSEEKAIGAQKWNIPFPRNPYFTGREQVFEKLHEVLRSGKIQVIKGLGGMGKTQTAVEYAFRYKKEYNAVLWSKADSRDAIVSGFTALAQKQVLDLPQKDEKDQNKIVEAVCWHNPKIQ